MKKAQYKTGRVYDGPQVLEIEYPEFAGDVWDEGGLEIIAISMRDASRDIERQVKVIRAVCNEAEIGPAVLASYDAKNYA